MLNMPSRSPDAPSVQGNRLILHERLPNQSLQTRLILPIPLVPLRSPLFLLRHHPFPTQDFPLTIYLRYVKFFPRNCQLERRNLEPYI